MLSLQKIMNFGHSAYDTVKNSFPVRHPVITGVGLGVGVPAADIGHTYAKSYFSKKGEEDAINDAIDKENRRISREIEYRMKKLNDGVGSEIDEKQKELALLKNKIDELRKASNTENTSAIDKIEDMIGNLKDHSDDYVESTKSYLTDRYDRLRNYISDFSRHDDAENNIESTMDELPFQAGDIKSPPSEQETSNIPSQTESEFDVPVESSHSGDDNLKYLKLAGVAGAAGLITPYIYSKIKNNR